MFIRLLLLLLVSAGLVAEAQQTTSRIGRVLEGAYQQIGKTTIYDGTYRRLPFPGGDVPLERGVCIDVWLLSSGVPHIGFVADRQESGRPLVIHNIGAGAKAEDVVFSYSITGHYRFDP